MTEDGGAFSSGISNEALRLEADYAPIGMLGAGLLGMTAGMFHGPINTIPEYAASLVFVGISTFVGIGISKIASRLLEETGNATNPPEFPGL